MRKHHFNPTTGEVGECRATLACPFGLALDEHFSSLREATIAAEAHLQAKHGSFQSKSEMVLGFEEWKAKKDGVKTQPAVAEKVVELAPTPALVDYRALMPQGFKQYGDYANQLGLDLHETWQIAGHLNQPNPQASFVTGVGAHVSEAAEKNQQIDEALRGSPYFSNPKFKTTARGVYVETRASHEGFELITRVDESGKASFEIYEYETGESQYSQDVNGWQNSIGDWMNSFKVYQDHLYLRVLWGKEQARRAQRLEDLKLRLAVS